MCGIFGYISCSESSRMSHEDIQLVLDVIEHRGPDQNGIYDFSSSTSIGALAHTRLSIIDLSGGKQPMTSDDGRFHISFNGEIYNFKLLKAELIKAGYAFKDSSDTEVLLAAYKIWGKHCVERLRGMFAFAIWDQDEQELFIARDQFGKKPVFFTEQNNALYFASEIKALQVVPGTEYSFNKEQIKNYSIYRYVPSPDTFLREVSKLPAGSYLVWKDGLFSITSYFSPAEKTSLPQSCSKDEAIKKFWSILDDAVELRMQADVPFGAFLSGGIDSSAVVALMCNHSPQKVKTFSIGFKEAEYSELGYARTIAEHFRTDHHEFIVSQDDLKELLPEVIRFRDAPVSEPSDIPIYQLSKAARKTVKMVLTGEGSDEILGGYPKHSFERMVGIYQLIPALIRDHLLAPMISALPYKFRRAKTAFRNININNFNERMPGWFGALSETQAEQLVCISDAKSLPELDRASARGSLRSILLFDQLSWLPDNLLERGDRMTMAASLEARMPFMDVELAKFAATLPDHYRIKGTTTKWILRKAMESVLPGKILSRPKVGFRVPVNLWFQTTMKDYLYFHLLGPDSITSDYYHKPVLEKIFFDHVKGVQNHEKVLWMLLNLEIWSRQNQDRINFQ